MTMKYDRFVLNFWPVAVALAFIAGSFIGQYVERQYMRHMSMNEIREYLNQ